MNILNVFGKKSSAKIQWLIKTIAIFLFLNSSIVVNDQTNNSDRRLWLSYMDKVARPFLMNFAEEQVPSGRARKRPGHP